MASNIFGFLATLAFLSGLAVSFSGPVRLRIEYELFDTATTATQHLTAWIPEGKRQHLILRRIALSTVFTLGVFGTAMFAEPAVTEVEKVIGLIQGSGESGGL